jgi:DNA polymerase I
MLPAGVEIPEKFEKANSDKPEVGKVNWSSPEQKVWAVEALGLEVPRRWDYKTKSEKKTLNKNYLYQLDHPIAEGPREYQAIANFPSTYARALRERFSEGRMYADWKQLEARTGRMSCCNPPMHNIPKKTKLREAIVAPEGYRIVTLDFSQIEPRILAAISRDTALLKAFREGLDIYRFVTERVTGTPMDQVRDGLRAVFKTIVLGMIYGMGPVSLTLRIRRDIDPKMPTSKIEEYYYGFFDAFGEAKAWRQGLEDEFDNGSRETRTIIGRRRLDVVNKRQRWNAPIQGSATDAFRAAAVTLLERREEVGGFRIIALIHDEVVLEVPEENAEAVEEWAGTVMAEAAAAIVNTKLPKKLRIETKVDSGAGATLQQAKDAAA